MRAPGTFSRRFVSSCYDFHTNFPRSLRIFQINRAATDPTTVEHQTKFAGGAQNVELWAENVGEGVLKPVETRFGTFSAFMADPRRGCIPLRPR